MRSRLARFVNRHPFPTFVALAYAFSWWPWILYALQRFDAVIVGFGPFLAAVLVLAMTRGRAGVTGLLRQMTQWRVGLRWYVLALGLPILLSGSAAWLNVLLGAPPPAAEYLAGWSGVPLTFLLFLLAPGISGAWEEPGWRGYALPHLERGRSRLMASLRLWLIIVVWHLPLFLTGKIEWGDVLAMMGGVIMYNWLYYSTDGSVFIIMVIHAANNSISGEFVSPMFSGADSERMAFLSGVIWCIAALVVVTLSRRTWRASEPPVQAEAVGEPLPGL